MSYSAVESLVEDLIYDTLISDLSIKNKNILIQCLYKFQEQFDTSDTSQRNQKELDKLGIDPSRRDLVLIDFWQWVSLVFNLLDKNKNYKLIQEFRYGLINLAYDLELDLSEFK